MTTILTNDYFQKPTLQDIATVKRRQHHLQETKDQVQPNQQSEDITSLEMTNKLLYALLLEVRSLRKLLQDNFQQERQETSQEQEKLATQKETTE